MTFENTMSLEISDEELANYREIAREARQEVHYY